MKMGLRYLMMTSLTQEEKEYPEIGDPRAKR
jgi:hypothetical protein